MDTVWQSTVQPAPIGLDPEVIESCLGQTAAAPTAFKCHLRENDRSRNTVLLLLSHRSMGVFLEKLIRSEKALFADMKSGNTLQLHVSYVSKEIVGIFKSPP